MMRRVGYLALAGLCSLSGSVVAQQGRASQEEIEAFVKAQAERAARERPAIEARIRAAAALPTPRTADDHPDLTGWWGAQGSNVQGNVADDGKVRKIEIVVPGGDFSQYEQVNAARRRLNQTNKPPYKPELVSKVEWLDEHQNTEDPTGFSCWLSPGVPRIGAPSAILQSPGWVTFVYERAENPNRFRIIPTDGRPHRGKNVDPSALGDSVGKWESDTLVIDTNRFIEETWLGDGYFHSDALRVVERLTRQGNTLKYEVTVEDPNVLTKPWIMEPRTFVMSGPVRPLEADLPCVERDREHLVGTLHN